MSKSFTKIICAGLAAFVTLGITAAAGCGGYYGSKKLSDEKGAIFTTEAAESNGGFAVKKGDYVYFVNGVESNTAVNKFGKVEKGAIYRIAASDFAAHNYSSVDAVVPLVTYTADYNAGIFVYGDYIYYASPSTAKNSDGEVLNSYLDLKRTKLDGTETMKNPYVQFAANTYEYRYVEDVDKDGKTNVYLVYVATDEKLYEEESGVKNLHSYNTATGDDTVLAYNVDNVIFDELDKTNARVYYTMNVKNYSSGSNYGYNQLYTVKAAATEDKFKDFDFAENIDGWNDDEDDEDKEVDRYINCGDLVFDGIGNMDEVTPFNYAYGKTGEEAKVNSSYGYTYSLSTYQGDTLFYTRTPNEFEEYDYTYLFSFKDSALGVADPIAANPENEANMQTLSDSAAPASYKYIFDGDELSAVLVAESDGITVNKLVNGKLPDKDIGDNYYYILTEAATMLFIDGTDLYYSVSGDSNGYSINRIDYTCERDLYGKMSETEYADKFTATTILDLDACAEWFMPEIIDDQIMFASETISSIYDVNYIMAFDLRSYDTQTKTYGERMSNNEIFKLNKQFKKISDIALKYEETDKTGYANLSNALQYAFFTGESAETYLNDLAKACNEAALKEDENADSVYSDKTLAKYGEFITPTADNDWSEFTATKKVNGEDIYANRSDYYYCMLGSMTEDDAEAFSDALKETYLKEYPTDDTTWYEGLSKGAKAGFIIGMCVIGLIVVGGATVLTLFLIRRKNKKSPENRKKKIKVDTTDDKDIDVYADSDAEKPTEE